MVTVSIESRHKAPLNRQYNFRVHAITWLLLAGYLPLDGQENVYINLYTREIAHVKLYR